jgi:hypothetical protein
MPTATKRKQIERNKMIRLQGIFNSPGRKERQLIFGIGTIFWTIFGNLLESRMTWFLAV